MKISNGLDYFDTGDYSRGEVVRMKEFMEYNFQVEKIAVACYVAPGGGVPVHRNRPHHGLALHTGGDRYYEFDGRKVWAMPNDIVYLPKGSDYIVRGLAPGGCYAINFDLSDTDGLAPFAFRVRNAGLFTEWFRQAERVWRTKPSGYEMKCKAELYNILYQMTREYELEYVSKSAEDRIRPALEYIRREYTNENIGIAYLAGLSGISETYFRRIFQNTMGTSPLKYINQLKISRAKELLASGICTVSEAAEQSGYHDEAYFSREFKRIVGMSPSEYQGFAR